MKFNPGLVTVKIIALSLIVLSGCSTSHVVFHQETVMGVDVAVSSETGTAKVVAGYDRQTTAYVPKTNINGKNKAMSVLSKTRINVDWFGPQQVHERFATGEAAISLADKPAAIRAFNPKKSKNKGENE